MSEIRKVTRRQTRASDLPSSPASAESIVYRSAAECWIVFNQFASASAIRLTHKSRSAVGLGNCNRWWIRLDQGISGRAENESYPVARKELQK